MQGVQVLFLVGELRTNMPRSQNKTSMCGGGNLPGGPVVKTLPSNAGGAGSIPGGGARIPHASWPKNQNIETEAIL